MMFCSKVTILGVVGSCRGSDWGWDGGHGGGWQSGELTLGEISLDSHGHKLPSISLGHSGLKHFHEPSHFSQCFESHGGRFWRYYETLRRTS